MNAKLVVDDVNDSPVTVAPKSEQFHRDGKPLSWCNSCGTYMPRHTCEWKVLISVVLGAGIACVAGVAVIFLLP